jgi:hypothetical protein
LANPSDIHTPHIDTAIRESPTIKAMAYAMMVATILIRLRVVSLRVWPMPRESYYKPQFLIE